MRNVDNSMKFLCTVIECLILLAVAEANIAAARFDDFKVYRLKLKDEQQISELKKLRQDLPITILNEVRGLGFNTDIVIDPANQRKLENKLRYLELDFKCVIEDLQSAIEEQNGKTNHNEAPSEYDKVHPKMNWTHYHTLPVIYKWLDDLAEEFPDFVKPFEIGRSYENRSIRGAKISYRPGNPGIFMDASIHAIEWISSAVLTCLMDNITRSTNEKLHKLRQKYDFYFIPVLNPDGFVYTHDVNRLWRKNRMPTGVRNETGMCFGVDLNRNFETAWATNSYNYNVACDHWFAGPEANSESEVKHWNTYMKSVAKKIKMYLSFHSYGNVCLTPYGYRNDIYPDNYDQMIEICSAYADGVRKVWGTEYRSGSSGDENYFVGGSSKDTAYELYGIPFSATMELRDNGEKGFFLPKEQIVDTCEEVIAGFIAMLEKAEEVGLFDESH